MRRFSEDSYRFGILPSTISSFSRSTSIKSQQKQYNRDLSSSFEEDAHVFDPQREKLSKSWDNSNLSIPRHQLVQEDTKFSKTNWNVENHKTQGIDEADVECVLCYRLLYQPVTTICGMSLCS